MLLLQLCHIKPKERTVLPLLKNKKGKGGGGKRRKEKRKMDFGFNTMKTIKKKNSTPNGLFHPLSTVCTDTRITVLYIWLGSSPLHVFLMTIFAVKQTHHLVAATSTGKWMGLGHPVSTLTWHPRRNPTRYGSGFSSAHCQQWSGTYKPIASIHLWGM